MDRRRVPPGAAVSGALALAHVVCVRPHDAKRVVRRVAAETKGEAMNYLLRVETQPDIFRTVGEIALECGQGAAEVCAMVLANRLGLPVEILDETTGRLVTNQQPMSPAAPVSAPISASPRMHRRICQSCGFPYADSTTSDPNLCPSCLTDVQTKDPIGRWDTKGPA
jgi:hypothetical protein